MINYRRSTALIILSLLSATVCARTQQPRPITDDRIVRAHEFLIAMYPGLSHKKYSLTLESYLSFDQPSKAIESLTMDVGEGPKDWLKYYAGCLTQPPIPAQPVRPPQVDQQPQENCRPGPVYPKQLLTAGFRFDSSGRLTSFTAEGEFINDHKLRDKINSIVQVRPEMTNAQIAALLKQSGVKYGPDDKQEFVNSLPFAQMEPFLGKLTLEAVHFQPLSRERLELDTWPYWTVDALTTGSEGIKLKYTMTFDRLRGDLTTLQLSLGGAK